MRDVDIDTINDFLMQLFNRHLDKIGLLFLSYLFLNYEIVIVSVIIHIQTFNLKYSCL